MLSGCDKDGKECLSCDLDNYISAVAISCFGDGMDIFFPSNLYIQVRKKRK